MMELEGIHHNMFQKFKQTLYLLKFVSNGELLAQFVY